MVSNVETLIEEFDHYDQDNRMMAGFDFAKALHDGSVVLTTSLAKKAAAAITLRLETDRSPEVRRSACVAFAELMMDRFNWNDEKAVSKLSKTIASHLSSSSSSENETTTNSSTHLSSSPLQDDSYFIYDSLINVLETTTGSIKSDKENFVSLIGSDLLNVLEKDDCSKCDKAIDVLLRLLPLSTNWSLSPKLWRRALDENSTESNLHRLVASILKSSTDTNSLIEKLDDVFYKAKQAKSNEVISLSLLTQMLRNASVILSPPTPKGLSVVLNSLELCIERVLEVETVPNLIHSLQGLSNAVCSTLQLFYGLLKNRRTGAMAEKVMYVLLNQMEEMLNKKPNSGSDEDLTMGGNTNSTFGDEVDNTDGPDDDDDDDELRYDEDEQIQESDLDPQILILASQLVTTSFHLLLRLEGPKALEGVTRRLLTTLIRLIDRMNQSVATDLLLSNVCEVLQLPIEVKGELDLASEIASIIDKPSTEDFSRYEKLLRSPIIPVDKIKVKRDIYLVSYLLERSTDDVSKFAELKSLFETLFLELAIKPNVYISAHDCFHLSKQYVDWSQVYPTSIIDEALNHRLTPLGAQVLTLWFSKRTLGSEDLIRWIQSLAVFGPDAIAVVNVALDSLMAEKQFDLFQQLHKVCSRGSKDPMILIPTTERVKKAKVDALLKLRSEIHHQGDFWKLALLTSMQKPLCQPLSDSILLILRRQSYNVIAIFDRDFIDGQITDGDLFCSAFTSSAASESQTLLKNCWELRRKGSGDRQSLPMDENINLSLISSIEDPKIKEFVIESLLIGVNPPSLVAQLLNMLPRTVIQRLVATKSVSLDRIELKNESIKLQRCYIEAALKLPPFFSPLALLGAIRSLIRKGTCLSSLKELGFPGNSFNLKMDSKDDIPVVTESCKVITAIIELGDPDYLSELPPMWWQGLLHVFKSSPKFLKQIDYCAFTANDDESLPARIESLRAIQIFFRRASEFPYLYGDSSFSYLFLESLTEVLGAKTDGLVWNSVNETLNQYFESPILWKESDLAFITSSSSWLESVKQVGNFYATKPESDLQALGATIFEIHKKFQSFS